MAATISATVTSGIHATASKSYALSDADLDRVVAAYQQDANISINGIATYAQVLLYMFNTVIVAALQAKVKSFETIPAVPGTPPPIT